MLLSSIIAGAEINHGKGGFGNYSSVLVPLWAAGCVSHCGVPRLSGIASCMQHEQASRTALLIAAGLILLHHDPKHSRLVSKTSADLCAHVLEEHSSQTRLFLKMVRQSWFRPIAKLVERITIPGILLHYALRKKCIKALVRSGLTNGVAQVVILGAGFDSLSSELQREFPTAQFWEIDHPATQRHKVRACSEIGVKQLHFLAIDLSTAGVDKDTLTSSGFDPGKATFWIAEGLLMYFPADTVSSLMKTLSTLSAPGSEFAFTFMEKQRDGHIRFDSQTKLVDWWLGRRGEPFFWGASRSELAEFMQPWRVIRFFDHNDLREMESERADEIIAKGEVICLAAI
jgi:methyltransferase (TIGR00027 family)